MSQVVHIEMRHRNRNKDSTNVVHIFDIEIEMRFLHQLDLLDFNAEKLKRSMTRRSHDEYAYSGRASGRTETALRLWMLMGLSLVLSGFLGVALTLSRPESLEMWHGEVPVYVPSLENMRAFIAEKRLERSRFKREEAGRAAENGLPSITLVETLPVGEFELESTLPQTFDVLFELTQKANVSIDISAMYWNLIGKDDRATYSDDEMKRFGADRGQKLLQALQDAAKRGVLLRIITAGDSIGGTGETYSFTKLPDELQQLVDSSPDHVQVHTWSGMDWYGGGILHQKLWIFDRRHVYVGSANMDWKSLAQVMEMGVLLRDLHESQGILEDIQRLFNVWWLWGAPTFKASHQTRSYFSDVYQADLTVPAWSHHIPKHQREHDPFIEAGLHSLSSITNQLRVTFANESGPTPSHVFVASSPLESTAGDSRAFDVDALVYTIRSATTQLDLSVMDFTPYSMYPLKASNDGPIWWPALNDAILAAVYGKSGLHVRLLISQWQHSRSQMFQALLMLQEQANLCQHMAAKCSGHLDIKIFRVPGWQNTTTPPNASHPATWPSFTRVNHAKYIVSDKRVNIGTSNMEWGYFHTTAGISVNSDHPATRSAMQAVFERNWNSKYAVPLNSTLIE